MELHQIRFLVAVAERRDFRASLAQMGGEESA
jgi:hypothetical protein